MSDTRLRINEIFFSIQGESTWAGAPCLFVRLTGCHLRCSYCDTTYAFYEGEHQSLGAIGDELQRLAPTCRLVQITGGEPLLQPGASELITALCDNGYTVLVETSGACDIDQADRRAVRIMDLKTPGSGESERNDWANLDCLQPHDQVKFVITDRGDLDWARDQILEHDLDQRVEAVVLSPAFAQQADDDVTGCDGLKLRDLAEWVLADPELSRRTRVQTQLHKIIWDPQTRGV